MFGQQQLKQQLALQQQQLQAQQAQLVAINRSMAVIEFDPFGTILTANENFLALTGYALNEIQGKHHRLFVTPSDASTSEYALFWKQLESGHFLADRFKRVGKNGQVVWIEATYNPILDETGKTVKVVKFATDVTHKVEAENDARGRLDAINRAMAVIEFDLQGNILDANENFLATIGYSLAEIQGKHHRLFVEPDYAQSREYQQFWQHLAQGQLATGTYKRLGKGGKVIWLEANYNPIFHADGKPYKVVKYATDIGSNRNTQLLQAVVADAEQTLSDIAQGNLTRTMSTQVSQYQDSMFYELIVKLDTAIQNMTHALEDIVRKSASIADSVSHAAGDVSQQASELSNKMQQQASALEETSAAMNEMSSSVTSNSRNSNQVADLAHQMQDQAARGVDVMQQTIDAMQSIQESSHKIADIVSLIDGIAFQTNLLALNAAVEAARAGEHGRGFAVVAGEVRALAQKSSEAAKDIRVLISDSVNRTEKGTQLADQSGKMLGTISEAISQVATMIEGIAQASREQSNGVAQINGAMNAIGSVTQDNTQLIYDASHSAEGLANDAQALRDNMAFFTTH